MNFEDNIVDFNKFKNKKDVDENFEIMANNFFDFKQKYAIKDNDPCICGSGKKYINCCANTNPNQPEEYYYNKLSEHLENIEAFKSSKKLNKIFKIVQNAVEDYPGNSVFNELAGVLAAELGNIDQAKNYLMKSYEILKDNLTLENTLYLLDILAELGDYEKVEKIGDNLKNNFNNHSFYLLLAEAKFMLNKKTEGYNYTLKAYDSSDNNIYILNTVIKILVGNNFYSKALKLLKNNYTRLQKIDPMQTQEGSVIIIFENTIKSLFNITYEKEDSTEVYLKYLDKLLEIFENINIDKKIKKEEINNIENIIPNNDTFSLFMVKLFYNFENYQWLSKNSKILLKKASAQEKNMITDLLINAHFVSENYENILEYKDYLYSMKFIKSHDKETIISAWSNYLLSLYYLQKDKEIIDFIMYIDKKINDETLFIILELISDKDYIKTIKRLQYIKNLDNNWGFNILDSFEVIDIQLTYLFYDLQLIDNPEFNDEEKELAKKLFKEYENYNADTFIYHYGKWLVNKSENKDYEVLIDIILNKPIKKNFAIPLNYYATLKILGPKYVLKNYPLRKKIPKENLEYLDTIAKIKKGEIQDLDQVFDKYPEQTEDLFITLQAVLTKEEMDKLLSN